MNIDDAQHPAWHVYAWLEHSTDLVTFSHPDSTVGPGLSPDPPLAFAGHNAGSGLIPYKRTIPPVGNRLT